MIRYICILKNFTKTLKHDKYILLLCEFKLKSNILKTVKIKSYKLFLSQKVLQVYRLDTLMINIGKVSDIDTCQTWIHDTDWGISAS